jgi:capsular polysaccharide export protein
VHNDAQVLYHADTGGVEGFIDRVIASFGRTAPHDTLLVIKHHPLDRGYRDYTRRIARAAAAAGCAARVVYIHDQHMPTILPHCRGTVVINSTAGLAAIGCGRPTVALGTAIYRLPGLTWQHSLARFWIEAADQPPDPALYARFRAELIARTQINGNFYRRLDRGGLATGLVWPERPQPATVVPFLLQEAAEQAADRREHARP